MVNNENFNNALNASGMSMYALSRRSGVPYTTINEICNNKNDINKCAAETVWRIATALSVSACDIMNRIFFLDGIKGKYKGINYTWTTDDSSKITFCYEGESVTLSTDRIYDIPSRLEYYQVIAGWMIKEYIEKKQWEKEALEQIIRRQKG